MTARRSDGTDPKLVEEIAEKFGPPAMTPALLRLRRSTRRDESVGGPTEEEFSVLVHLSVPGQQKLVRYWSAPINSLRQACG